MRHSLVITSVVSKVPVPAALLEDLVNHRRRRDIYRHPLTGIEAQLFAQSYETIVTCSMQTSVKGLIQIRCWNSRRHTDELMNVPVGTFMLATCVKAREDRYKVELICSLN